MRPGGLRYVVDEARPEEVELFPAAVGVFRTSFSAQTAGRGGSDLNIGFSQSWRRALFITGAAGATAISGCSSLLTEGTAAGAGVAGAAVAGALTKDASTTAAIGLGVNAAALAGVKALEKRVHADEQDAIAVLAGALAPGATVSWTVQHRSRLEADEHGNVTVVRLIQAGDVDCKEVVFTVERLRKTPTVTPYVTTICRTGLIWRWASAEPSTRRWGALQ